MGATGHVTGQHLHYEISYNEEKVDPLPYLESTPSYVLK
jgi:murein DD-endopeptidase MepM/ murein hydrolase activator NlpD